VVRSDVQLTAPHKNWAHLIPAINPIAAHLLIGTPSLISIKFRGAAGRARVVLARGSESAPVLGYIFGVIMPCSAVVALALGLFKITAAVNGPRQRHPVIAHTVPVETQRHSPVAKEASAAKDVTPGRYHCSGHNQSKHHKPKVFARQRDNYGYWNTRGYAQRDFFFR
jgi:hypothetical protein